MRFGAVLSAVVRTYRDRPTDLVPFYALSMAIAAIAQFTMMIGLLFAVVYLAATNRLADFAAEFETIDSPPDPETEPAAFEAWFEESIAAFDPVLAPAVGLFVLLAGLLTIVIVAVATAAISAGQLSACFGRLRRERGLLAGVGGARRYWVTFLGIYFLELGFWIGLLFVSVLGFALGAFFFAIGGAATLVGVLIMIATVLGAFVGAIAIRGVFAFAGVAVVVDDVRAVRSVRHAAGFVRYNLSQAALYYLVVILAFVAIGVATSVLAVIGAAAGTGLVFTLVVLPILDLLKTALYGGGRGAISPPGPTERSLIGQTRAGASRGVRTMATFVRETPGTHLLATGMLAGGLVVGWVLGGPLADAGIESSIDARLAGHVAPVAALEFFGNNWSVAFTMAFGGILIGLPALWLLAFNGVVIGALARTEVDLDVLLAFVTPHGLLEIPAIIIAGGAGIALGRHWWATYRAKATRADLADALERVVWVLVGVGVLLAIAAFIEGFISPYYWRPFL